MASLMVVNPSRRPSHRKAHTAKRKTTAHKHHPKAKTYRRNPVTRLSAATAAPRRRFKRHAKHASLHLKSLLLPALQGAGGAVIVDYVTNAIPLPANLKTGTLGAVVKTVAAVGVGMAVSKFAKGDMAANMARGALTVELHKTLTGLVGTALPHVGKTLKGMGEVGDYYETVSGLAEMPAPPALPYQGDMSAWTPEPETEYAYGEQGI